MTTIDEQAILKSNMSNIVKIKMQIIGKLLMLNPWSIDFNENILIFDNINTISVNGIKK